MSNTEHKLPKLVINKALHMSTPEQCANTEAAVTAHVAQDSRTAHAELTEILDSIKSELTQRSYKLDRFGGQLSEVLPYIEKVIDNYKSNTEAAVTAHVAQDSRTAHAVSDLYSVKSIVHELYFADDSVTRDDALVLIIRHIKNLLAKYE